jgi:GMP synthase-like glutamine amidotransferase
MIKAGLFMCDHVADEYNKEFGDYSDMFMHLFPDFDWTLYDCVNGIFPKDLNECDVYFATGSKHSVYEDIPWILRLKKVIAELYLKEKCFVGFCFGHQLIGESLGGKVEKSPNGWCVGVHDFEVINSKKWMVPSQMDFAVLMMCQDQILELPHHSEVLAQSEKCPYALIQVGERFLGIQGHPEFSKEYDQMLMETRMNRMGDEVALSGIKSLSKNIDNDLIKAWVVSFVKSKIRNSNF